MFWKKHRGKILAALFLAALLVAAYYVGGGGVRSHGWTVQDRQTPPGETVSASVPADPAVSPMEEVTPEDTSAPEETPTVSQAPEESQNPDPSPSPGPAEDTASDPDRDAYCTNPVPEGKPAPVEPQDAKTGEQAYACTLSVSCATLLDNLESLDEDKRELVPEDGWILAPVTVTFYEGESVFNVLQRTVKQQGIHMEFVNTPVYNSAYIEGIGNLYEFDAGELSGWMYRVDGWFPNYGCSRYALQDGDEVEWVYTCDLGRDVGGYITEGGQKDA